MSGRTFVAAALALAAMTQAGVAAANGRYPLAGQIAFSPSQPDLMALRATFGLLISRDGGHGWSWVCEPAVGYTDMNEDPSIGWTTSAAVVGMFEGLAVSPDDGCSWSTKIALPMTDLVVRRDDPRAALALTSAYAGFDDAGDLLFASTVYATTDDGASWTTFGATLDPMLVPETIDVSGDGTSVYVSGYAFLPGNARQGVFLRSTDQGAHFTRSTIDLGPLEAAPYIAAIDPGNPLRVYVRVSAAAPNPASTEDASTPGDRLLVSDDGGTTFRTVFTSAGPLLGFALSPDGKKVYTGGPDDGVLMADAVSLSFTKKSSVPVECLGASAAGLFACSDDNVAFFLGLSTDDGATFAPALRLPCVGGALACPSGTSTAQCGLLFGGLAQLNVGTGGPKCGGASDAALDAPPDDAAPDGSAPSAGEPSPAPPPSSSSCRTAPSGRDAYGAWGLVMTAAALAGWRATRTRRRGRRRG